MKVSDYAGIPIVIRDDDEPYVKDWIECRGCGIEVDEEGFCEKCKDGVECYHIDCAYSRTGTIEWTVDECRICDEKKDVLSVDCSEGEYGPMDICEDCLGRLKRPKDRIPPEPPCKHGWPKWLCAKCTPVGKIQDLK